MRQSKKRWGKKWLWIAAAVVILLSSLLSGDEVVEVSVTKPEIGSISVNVPANGKIRPVTEIKIAPEISGEIIEIFCQEGDYVTKGELLIKIKQDTYISVLEQAQGVLNASKAQYRQQQAILHKEELSFERSRGLFNEKAISQSEYEESQLQLSIAKSALEAAEFNVQSAIASVKEAEENLSKTSIYAPMSGTISRLSVEKGERVVGTFQMAGTEMLRISDFSQMEAVVEVNENDIVNVEMGDTAVIEVDAIRWRDFKGIVTKVSNSASNTGYTSRQISSFEVKILILDPIMELRPGMSATASVETEKKEGIITIPLGCINANGCIFVVGNDGETVNERHISTGLQDINKIEVVSGVSPDDEVVVSPYEAINKRLTDNGKIFIDRDQH